MDKVEIEKAKYEEVHSRTFSYGLGLRQVRDLKNESYDFSKRFNEIVKQSNTCLDIAKKIILECKKAGADAVKFQMWRAKDLYSKTHSD